MQATTRSYAFKPLNVGRILVWSLFALLLLGFYFGLIPQHGIR